MGVFRLTSLAAVGLAAVGLATAADARRVTVDSEFPYLLGGCTLDKDSWVEDLCKPVDLGFTVAVTFAKDPEFGDDVRYINSVVLYDDGFISFDGDLFGNNGGDLEDEVFGIFGLPVVVAEYALQDNLPDGQFVIDASDVIRGKDTFEVSWYRARIDSCEFDEENPTDCPSPFFKVKKEDPHARLLIESLPGNGARFTLTWTEGAKSFGYWLGEDVYRELGGNGERFFQFSIGDSQPIPEPATWAMMIAGFGLVGAAARKRRRLSAA